METLARIIGYSVLINAFGMAAIGTTLIAASWFFDWINDEK